MLARTERVSILTALVALGLLLAVLSKLLL
jgi:hypothetical protein